MNEDSMLAIMREQKKPVKADVTLSGDNLRTYFPQSYTPLQMEPVIFTLLDKYLTCPFFISRERRFTPCTAITQWAAAPAPIPVN